MLGRCQNQSPSCIKFPGAHSDTSLFLFVYVVMVFAGALLVLCLVRKRLRQGFVFLGVTPISKHAMLQILQGLP